MAKSRTKALCFMLTIIFAIAIFAVPAMASPGDLRLDAVVVEVGGTPVLVVVSLDEYADAYDVEGNELWDYLCDGKDHPHIKAVISGDKVIDLTEYANNFDGSVSDAIENSEAMDPAEVAEFMLLKGFEEDGTPIKVPYVEPEVVEYVANRSQFISALDDQSVDKIIFTANITLNNTLRIDREVEVCLDGYQLSLLGGNGPLVLEADNIKITDGLIRGMLTYFAWDELINIPDYDSNADDIVMVYGDGARFDNVAFHVDIVDWWQVQANQASDLVISNSALHGLSLFNGDVRLVKNDIYNRVGIEHNAAVLEGNMLRTLLAHEADNDTFEEDVLAIGILYINSNAYLKDTVWADNFTGMYVGKSLKYHGQGHEPGTYSPAKPTLDGARIETDKYGLVWWGINHYKAELHTTGHVVIESERGGPGLMLVGTDASDYGEPFEFKDGGKILGDAQFKGADVWFGKPTAEFLNERRENYEGKYDKTDVGDKCPVCIDYVDHQACHKDADRLLIDGPNFYGVDVTIFTPANDYIGCLGPNAASSSIALPSVCLADPVWLGDVTFNYVALWGDFNIVTNKTVDFKEIELKCGNIRRIGSDEKDDRKTDCSLPFAEFDHRGTLRGGTITSDTKSSNVLVIGDGVKVVDVVLSEWLYNVILETAKLQGVQINVGLRNPQTYRDFCDHILTEYDVFVWTGHHATFQNVTLNSTRVEVMDLAKLSVLDNFNYKGNSEIKVQKEGFVNYPPFDSSIKISQLGGRAYIDYVITAQAPWKFNDWKPDIWIQADDPYSVKYEFIFRGYRILIDLADPDNPLLNGLPHPNAPFNLTEGMWLTELLDIDREELATVLTSTTGRIRISAEKAIDFDLKLGLSVFNCCDHRYDLTHTEGIVDLTPKPIQVGQFDIEAVDKDLEVVAGSVGNEVNFTVRNVGTKRTDGTIRLYVNNAWADSADIPEIDPGTTYSGTMEYTAPCDEGEIEIKLVTERDEWVQSVDVVAGEIDADMSNALWNPGSACCLEGVLTMNLKNENGCPIAGLGLGLEDVYINQTAGSAWDGTLVDLDAFSDWGVVGPIEEVAPGVYEVTITRTTSTTRTWDVSVLGVKIVEGLILTW